MTDETDPIEAWAALDPERAGVDWLTAPDRAGPVDRTVRPELVALVQAAERRRAADASLRAAMAEWQRADARHWSEPFGDSPSLSPCHSAMREFQAATDAEDAALDALRAKLRATMGEP